MFHLGLVLSIYGFFALLILLYRLGMIFIVVAHDLQKKPQKRGIAIFLMVLGYLIAIPVGMILLSLVITYLMMRF